MRWRLAQLSSRVPVGLQDVAPAQLQIQRNDSVHWFFREDRLGVRSESGIQRPVQKRVKITGNGSHEVWGCGDTDQAQKERARTVVMYSLKKDSRQSNRPMKQPIASFSQSNDGCFVTNILPSIFYNLSPDAYPDFISVGKGFVIPICLGSTKQEGLGR